MPYTDGGYYARRPTQAVPADRVIQIGSDVRGRPLGLHPNLPGLGTMFEDGNVAIIQRTGYANSSRSHFRGTDIWSTANPGAAQGPGWMGRYLDTLPSPVDPLVAWNTSGQLSHTLQSASVGIPSIPDPVAYAFTSPNLGVEATYSATAAQEMRPICPRRTRICRSSTPPPRMRSPHSTGSSWWLGMRQAWRIPITGSVKPCGRSRV